MFTSFSFNDVPHFGVSMKTKLLKKVAYIIDVGEGGEGNGSDWLAFKDGAYRVASALDVAVHTNKECTIGSVMFMGTRHGINYALFETKECFTRTAPSVVHLKLSDVVFYDQSALQEMVKYITGQPPETLISVSNDGDDFFNLTHAIEQCRLRRSQQQKE
jgi:hypothetical protein